MRLSFLFIAIFIFIANAYSQDDFFEPDDLFHIDHMDSHNKEFSLYFKGREKSILARGENDNYTQTLFDQESNVNIDEGAAPFSGRFIPVQNISSIYGTPSKGIWKLIVVDQEKQDSGQLLEFELRFCLEGLLDINSDNDSLTDKEDNCPKITNEDQADIDNNNIGDLCDIFSAQNISITKKDATCPNSENGSLAFDARADYLYKALITSSNGFQEDFFGSSKGTIRHLRLQTLLAR